MRIQYFSGLFGKFTNIKNLGTDILCMLGDIGNPFDKKTLNFLRYCSKEWKHIYWVGGITEYSTFRSSNVPVSIDEMAQELNHISPQNCKFLNNSIDEITISNKAIIFGTSLWTGKEVGLHHLPSGDSTLKPIMPWEMETIKLYNQRWLTGVNEEIEEHYPGITRICLTYSRPNRNLIDAVDPTVWFCGKNSDEKYLIEDSRLQSNYENRWNVTWRNALK